MNSIEDRLRDAYRGAAETVDPDTVRQLHERSATISSLGTGPDTRLHRRLMIPLAAASAVALVAVVTAVVIPAALDRARHAPQAGASPAGRYVVQLGSGSRASLTVRSLRTAAAIATIHAPEPGMTFIDVTSGNGRTYVAVLTRVGVCGSWLYKFRLGSAGHPTALTTLPVTTRAVTRAALSKDGSTLALATQQCPHGRQPLSPELAVVNLATGQTRHWPLPHPSRVGSVSLTASGSLLAYTFGGAHARASVYVLPTNADPGPALRRSRLVTAAGRFGARDAIGTAVITPDGSSIYFATHPAGSVPAEHWQLRAVSPATGRVRVVGRYAGVAGDLAADPSVTRVLVVVRSSHQPAPSPTPVPSPSASPHQTAQPTPSASPHRTPLPTPSPSPSRTRGPGSSRLELISLSSGSPRILRSPAWAPRATLAYYW